MGVYSERVRKAADHLRAQGAGGIHHAIILGSGLGELASQLEITATIPYGEVPGFPVSTVPGHAGRFGIATLKQGVRFFVMAGRTHLYEGYSALDITVPVRALALLGVRHLILTCAVGAIDESATPGEIVLVNDHINLTGHNPLIGGDESDFAPRFVDMTHAYSIRLRRLAAEAGRGLGLRVRQGVYAGLAGPSFETPAEIRMLRTLGADMVGMSVVNEVIAARQSGMEVLCLAFVSNMAAGVDPHHTIDHDAVQALGRKTQARLGPLLTDLVLRLATSEA